ncbi:MAG: chemotaxis protein CheW, partial [Phycisphaerae bacterium]
VEGVINLRGEVVTVIDLCKVLKIERTTKVSDSRNIIVNSMGEHIGLLVDRIADVVTARSDEIDPLVANLHGIDGRFFEGVFRMDSELMVILDVEEILTRISQMNSRYGCSLRPFEATKPEV